MGCNTSKEAVEAGAATVAAGEEKLQGELTNLQDQVEEMIGVLPITTTMDAAPERLLHIMSCKCATGCALAGCSCKKAGLKCSALCKHCVGTTCENAPEYDVNKDNTDDDDYDDDDDDDDDDTDDVFDSLYQGETVWANKSEHSDDDDDDEDIEPEGSKKPKMG